MIHRMHIGIKVYPSTLEYTSGLFIVILICNCGISDADRLVGIWELVEFENHSDDIVIATYYTFMLIYTFYSNGDFILREIEGYTHDYSGIYSLSGNTLILTFDDMGTIPCDVVIHGDEMTLEIRGKLMTFRKQ